jgi:hypothetical protein
VVVGERDLHHLHKLLAHRFEFVTHELPKLFQC